MKNKKITSSYAWFERGAYTSKTAQTYLTKEFDPQKIKKIAVIRHAALGDQVITRPFLVELRKFFPNANITLVAVSNYQYGMPSDLVDDTLVIHGKDKKNEIDLKEKLLNIKKLGEQDIIFDLAGTNRSYWVTALTKAKLKFGFPYKSYLRGLLYNVAVFRSDFQAEVEVMLDMLRLLGHLPPSRLDFAYPDNQILCDKQNPYVVYFNGCSQPRRTLSNEQIYALLEDATHRFPEQTHIFLEGLNETEKGGYLTPLQEKDNFKIQPCMDLKALIEFIAKAHLVVSVDTGVLNVAVSTHTPCVGLFYSTNPYRVMPRYESIYKIAMNSDSTIPSNKLIIEQMDHFLASDKG